MPHLEITEVVLIHFNIVNNDFQQLSTVFNTFVPNKSFDLLLSIIRCFTPKNFYIPKSFGSDFSHFKVWFGDKNSRPF